MARKKATSFNFENSLKELEKIVETMEQGEISLEESLTQFQRGIELTRSCQKALQDAEQKVQVLLDKEEQAELQPFDKDHDQ